jgi:hypothetical protein
MAEAWLSGPIHGVSGELTPEIHALMQSSQDIEGALGEISTDQLWLRPGGAASIGFHLQHIAGSLDRLLTYARGEQLTSEQVAAARTEREPGEPPRDAATMQAIALAGIASAIEVIRKQPVVSLLEPREVGRARLPATVLGVLFHCAEHTQRHAGQIVTTAKIVRGLNLTR